MLGVVGLVLLPQPWPKRFLVALARVGVRGARASYRPRTSDELRVTFLAVGHGGCVVIETPDGRVLPLRCRHHVRAGRGAAVDRTRISGRGALTRIDEVFLSHADLDHFNGMPELLRRFPVARVTVTPSFANKSTPGVETVLAAFEKRGSRCGSRWSGERFEAGRADDRCSAPADGRAGPARGREPAEHGAAGALRRAHDPSHRRPRRGGAGDGPRAAGSAGGCDARAAPRREDRERGRCPGRAGRGCRG